MGECSLPRSVEYGLACYYLVAPAEASSNLARYDGVRYGHRADGVTDLLDMYMRTRWEGFGDEPKRRIMLGTYALSAGYYDAYYGQAQKVRTMIGQEFAAAFEDFDLLVSPTSPTVAFRIGEKADNPLALYLCDVLTIPPNMAGLPGLSIPCGLSDGLPVGLQLLGPQFSREPPLSGRPRARAGDRVRLRPGAPAMNGTSVAGAWEAGHRARDPRPAEDADEDVLPLRERWGEEPNTRTCPVCLAFPGSLPVPNRTRDRMDGEARARPRLPHRRAGDLRAQALLLSRTPKGYQISQYEEPLCLDGRFVVPGADGDHEIGIVRAHLEEDAAKTIHVGGAAGRIHGAETSLVDFNRGGTPLVEIVSQPDLRSADEAKRFLQLLRQTVVELGISDAEMEKGSLRCDANVSVRKAGESGSARRPS